MKKTVLPVRFRLFLSLFLLSLMTAPGQCGSILKQLCPFSGVRQIVQEGDNLWCATSGGAVRYNLTTKAITPFNDLDDVPDLSLVSVVKDASGDLWFGSADGYVTRLHPPTVTFTSFNACAASGWSITCMLFFKDYLLIGTNNGLSIFSPSSGVIIQNVRQFGSFKSFEVAGLRSFGDTIALLAADADTVEGIAYAIAADMKKANLFNPDVWHCITAHGAFGIMFEGAVLKPADRIVFQDGTVTWKYGGIDSDTAAGGGINSYPSVRLFFNGTYIHGFPTPVTSVCSIDPAVLPNSFAVGTKSSFWYLCTPGPAGTGNIYTQITLDGPPTAEITGCALDKEGIVWFMPQDMTYGIGQYDHGAWKKLTNDNTEGLGWMGPCPGGAKNTILITSQNDVWAGTYGYGCKWLNRRTQKWATFTDPKSPMPTLASTVRRWQPSDSLWWTFVPSACEDSRGFIWLANHRAYDNNVVHVHKTEGNLWRPFNVDTYKFPSSYVGPIAAALDRRSGRQNIYVGHLRQETMEGGGLTIISYPAESDPFDSATVFTVQNDDKNVSINDFAAANDSVVWFASDDGLYKVTNHQMAQMKKIQQVTSSGPLYAVTIGMDGRPVFCKDKDLFSYGEADSSLHNLTRSGVLGSVTSIALDRKTGTYWMAGKKGLYRFSSGMTSDSIPGPSSVDIYPNPVSRNYLKNGHVVRFTGLDRVSAAVKIYDAGGALVRSLSETNTQIINWNGTNASGGVIVPGIYFYRVKTANGSYMRGKLFVTP
jgi:hypothetical protein